MKAGRNVEQNGGELPSEEKTSRDPEVEDKKKTKKRPKLGKLRSVKKRGG